MSEFDLYCQNKSPEVRAALAPVRDLILETLPGITEGRAHFYLVYTPGYGASVKLHADAKGLPNLSFVTGHELDDPSRLLKGKSLVRSVKITTPAYLAKHRAAIVALIAQSGALIASREDGSSRATFLSPDQKSP